MSGYRPNQLYAFITELVRNASQGSVHYLEIGTQNGGSAEAAFNSGRVSLAVLVDTWGGEYGGSDRRSPAHVIERLGTERMRNTLILSGRSDVIVPLLEHRFDVIFVDGDHSASGCLTDMENCRPKLAQGGCMVVDDIDHPRHSDLRGVVEQFASKYGMQMTSHDVHYGVAVLRASLTADLPSRE